jgi:hypothetical protein
MAPGLDYITTCDSGPVRGTHVFGSTLIVVSGSSVYSVNTAWNPTLLGTIGTSSGPVSIIDNGAFGQCAIFDGSAGYLVTSGGAFSTLTLPFSGPAQATYQDTFGLVYAANTNEWFQSNAGDLSTWGALNFSSADGLPDNIVAMKSIHREIWLLKQYDTEIWTDQGNAGFSFGRLDGVFIEQGCAAQWSVAKSKELMFWLSRNKEGGYEVVMAEGYRVVPISHSGMSAELATYSTVSDAIGYTYRQEGQSFYVLTFPTAGVTWCYTQGLWHKRAQFLNGAWDRHLGNSYSFFNGKCVVGDYRTGNLYAFNLDNPTDNGVARKWLRTWRALKQAPNAPMRFNHLEIQMET